MPNKRKCKYSLCQLEFIPVPGRFNQKTCDNIECARGYLKEQREAKESKETKELLKAYKHDSKTHGEYKGELQDLINKIVRLIDKGHPCISSGFQNYVVHAGHFYSVGAHDNLRYHLFNIWAQADHENTYKSANITAYREGLINTFGQGLMDEIDGLEAKYPSIPLSKADIIERKFVANKIIRELEEADKVYTTVERIALRIKFNERLNIYN